MGLFWPRSRYGDQDFAEVVTSIFLSLSSVVFVLSSLPLYDWLWQSTLKKLTNMGQDS
jgi:hypothetical protein